MSHHKSINKLAANPNWKGGKRKRGKYLYLRVENHPSADCMGYVAEHRYNMEQQIGRQLQSDEVVHHKDENTLNNQLSNLQLMSRSEHITYHNIKNPKIKRNSK